MGRVGTKALQQSLGQLGDTIPGEDRFFGGNSFYIDMTPPSMWFVNVRAIVPPSHWSLISSYVILRAHGKCEMCGSSERLETHERWELDFASQTMRLKRLMCLCKLCHLGVHIGNAGRLGLREKVEDHIFPLTLWGKREMRKHIREAQEALEIASMVQWKPDMSIIEATGATIYSQDVIEARIQAKREKAASFGVLDFDGYRIDLQREMAAGDVVIVAKRDEDMLDGIPLDVGPIGTWYTCKSPSLLPEGTTPRLPLSEFLRAFAQVPHHIQDAQELQRVIEGEQPPKHLVMDDINQDEAERLLVRGIVVTRE